MDKVCYFEITRIKIYLDTIICSNSYYGLNCIRFIFMCYHNYVQLILNIYWVHEIDVNVVIIIYDSD